MSADSRATPATFDSEVGFAVLADFLTSEEVAEVSQVCADFLQLPPENRRARDKPNGGTQHLAELNDRSDLIEGIIQRRDVVALVAEILGPTFRAAEVAYRCPQPGYGYQRLHADGIGPTATAIVALTDFTLHNGATRVVPGSHLRPDLRAQSGKLEDHPDQIVLTGPAGTAFVLSGHVLHSGTQNDSDSPRPALHVVWRPQHLA